MKRCPSYPGYSATADGVVISHRRRGTRKRDTHGGSVPKIDEQHNYELSPSVNSGGYLTVGVCINGVKSRRGVHQLVADAFIGPVPKGYLVRHLDGNRSNNTPQNLAYGTPRQNAEDRKSHGRYFYGEDHHNAKLTKNDVLEIIRARNAGMKVKDLSTTYGVSVSTIEGVIYEKHYTFKRVDKPKEWPI
jgi:hypothetical protein